VLRTPQLQHHPAQVQAMTDAYTQSLFASTKNKSPENLAAIKAANPPEKIIEAIKDILREAKTTTTTCGVALPLSSSLIIFVTIPPVPEKEVANVVALEARKYIPVPLK
jgi:Tfp pilus assembly PilM family ATPase